MPMMLKIKIYADLCRIPLSLFAAASAATGYALGAHPDAAGALGQQPRGRPACLWFVSTEPVPGTGTSMHEWPGPGTAVPSGALTSRHALLVSIALLALGLAVLGVTSTVRTVMLGIIAIGWYNGVYTFLKKRTALAFLPGAIVGMIPPAIGWTAAGGSLLDPRLAVISLLFFLWQMPHVWLLLLQYGGEYEQAGLPSLARWLNRDQIARLAFTWIAAMAAASLAIPFATRANALTTYAALIPAAAWLAFSGYKLLGVDPGLPAAAVFRRINVHILVVMCTLCLGRFIPLLL